VGERDRQEHQYLADGPTELATDRPFSEAELTALALAADPSVPLAADAVPLAQYLGEQDGLLPAWYMPSPMVRSGGRWRIPVVVAIVAAFVIIEAFGLCSTFGQLVPA
jgi:hypothetical protein